MVCVNTESEISFLDTMVANVRNLNNSSLFLVWIKTDWLHWLEILNCYPKFLIGRWKLKSIIRESIDITTLIEYDNKTVSFKGKEKNLKL